MNIRLLTLIGPPITTLAPFFHHYAELGVSSFTVYVHETDGQPSLLPQVSAIAKTYADVSIVPISGDWLTVQFAVLGTMREQPDDWFVIADQDEFQLYPLDLARILAEADRRGFDSINGCLVDRVAEDVSLKPLDPTVSIWSQYPIGALLTYPVCGSNFRKVVAAKGKVQLTNAGHHEAVAAVPYPAEEMLIEVHHFKWVAGLIEYLLNRSSPESPFGTMVSQEGLRFVDYFRSNNNRIPLEDPLLMAGPCNPHFANWEAVLAAYFELSANR
jgi:hypothetical protein